MHVCWNIQSGLQDALILLRSAAMKQPAMACSCSNDSDIRKKGFLLKIKTSKKKLFVLREESSSGPARLEYYDSEKKLRAGGLARRCVLLKNCFSINAKTDGSRHRHAIVLYTKDDCFGIACESEVEQQAWLREMIELRQMSLDNMTQKRPILKHVWPVSVEAVDGKCTLIAPGPYRLCLTATNLTLIPLTSGLNEIVVPLDSIRCCGHGECLFLLEVDRSSMVDAGELWLKTDDSVVAQCMHDTLVDLLASFSESRNPFRARAYTSIAAIGSGSTFDARRAVIMRSKMRHPAFARNSAVVDSMTASGSTWSESLEQQIKHGKTPGMNYFVMKPGQDSDAVPPSDSGYIEMKPPKKDAYIDMCPGRCRSDVRCRQNLQTFQEEVAAYSLNSLQSRPAKSKSGYMDMTPVACQPQDATSMLASRMSTVRSYVHEGSGDSDEDDSDDSAGRTSLDSLPKERAYSVGSKPAVHSRIRFLGRRAGKTEAPSEINGNVPEETAVGISDAVAAPVEGKLSSREEDYVDLTLSNAAAQRNASGMKRRTSAAEVLARQMPAELDPEERLRPRTSTFPWDLLRSTDPSSTADDPLRPRSSSGSNPTHVRDAVRARLAASRSLRDSVNAGVLEMMRGRTAGGVSPDVPDTSEYMEMHRPSTDAYMQLAPGKKSSAN